MPASLLPCRLHARPQRRQLRLHRRGRELDPLAMPRQDPGKRVALQRRHRLDLLRPQLPTVLFGGAQALLHPTPPQVIAAEQETLAVEQHATPSRVPGSGNDQEVRRNLQRLVAVENDLGIRLGGGLGAMDEALAAKAFGILVCLCDVIAMGQKDGLQATALLEPSHEMRQGFRRVDQPIAVGVPDEIATAAVRVTPAAAAAAPATPPPHSAA
jgi:hypothetical protein